MYCIKWTVLCHVLQCVAVCVYTQIDWCCFYDLLRNSLVALLEDISTSLTAGWFRRTDWHMYRWAHVIMRTRLNQICQIFDWVMSRVWRSHVTYECIMASMNESCQLWISLDSCVNEPLHVWVSRVTYEWVMSRIKESCHVWTSHFMYEWVMSGANESCHVWMRHGTYKWVRVHYMYMSHVTYEWVTSNMDESCHVQMSRVTLEWVMARINV